MKRAAERAVDHAVVVATATAAASAAARTPCRPTPASSRALRHAEDRDFGRVDDRRERGAADAAERWRSRSIRPACRPGPSLPSRAFFESSARLLRDLEHALPVGVRAAPARPGRSACRRRSRCGSTSSAPGSSPSSEALKSGNFFSAATAALIRKASIVSLMPSFSFSLLSWTRSASSSVMSASSCCVTCGIITQLRAQVRAGDLLDARQRLRLDRRRTWRSRPAATAAG